MNIILRTLLSSLSILIISILVLFTFGSKEQNINFTEFEYQTNPTGFFELSRNGNFYNLEKLSEEIKKTDRIIVEHITEYDSVIFTGENYEFNNKSEEIKIGTGSYVFQVTDPTKKYAITSPGFHIKNTGPGTFLVNAENPKKIAIFSLNNQLEIELLDKVNNSTLTLNIYPHSYFIFNPDKNIYAKNADLLKIKQIFNLGYFSGKFFDSSNLPDTEVLKILSLGVDSEKNFIENVFFYIRKKHFNSQEIFQEYTQISPFVFPGEEYITQYFTFFLNKEKKRIYYENLILNKLTQLYNSEKSNEESIVSIIKMMDELQQFDSEAYQEMKNVVKYYYKNILLTQSNSLLQTQFYNLISKIEKTKNTPIDSPSFYIKNTFLQYDFEKGGSFYNYISIFIEKYLEENELSNIDQHNQISLSYLLYFLENILLSDFSNEDAGLQDIDNLIIIFNNYVDISNTYFSYKDNDIKSGIYIQREILEKFLKLIKTTYFKAEKNTNGLLQLSGTNRISEENLNTLQGNINSLLNFFNENKTLLENSSKTQDKGILIFYSKANLEFNNYFSALKNYTLYLAENDKILSIPTINEGTFNQEILTEGKAREYISQFNGIVRQDYSVEIKGYSYCTDPNGNNNGIQEGDLNYCYLIHGLNINGTIFNFILRPYDGNRMEEIEISQGGNVKKENGYYKLDDLKESYNEQYKSIVEQEEKSKYDFKNFFINTFFGIQEKSSQLITEDNNSLIEEDKGIKGFKRNQLLGENSDFALLEDILSVIYNDIIVTRENDSFKTFIKQSILSITLKEGRSDSTYTFDFMAHYDFPSHTFFDIIMKYKDKNGKYLLSENPILIQGDFPIQEFKNDIIIFVEKVKEIRFIIDALRTNLGVSQVETTYIKSTGEIQFNFQYNGEKLFILLKDGKIINFNYNATNLVPNTTSYTNISNVIKKLLITIK